MSGNVQEWTRSLKKPYPYDSADGREDLESSGARVVRGGSFSNLHQSVRAAGRDDFDPVNRDGDFGVRVVVSRSRS